MSLDSFFNKLSGPVGLKSQGGRHRADYWLPRCQNCEGTEAEHDPSGKCLFQPSHFLGFNEELAAAKALQYPDIGATGADFIREQLAGTSMARSILMPVPKLKDRVKKRRSRR